MTVAGPVSRTLRILLHAARTYASGSSRASPGLSRRVQGAVTRSDASPSTESGSQSRNPALSMNCSNNTSSSFNIEVIMRNRASSCSIRAFSLGKQSRHVLRSRDRALNKTLGASASSQRASVYVHSLGRRRAFVGGVGLPAHRVHVHAVVVRARREPRFTSSNQEVCDSMRWHACWRRSWRRNPGFLT